MESCPAKGLGSAHPDAGILEDLTSVLSDPIAHEIVPLMVSTWNLRNTPDSVQKAYWIVLGTVPAFSRLWGFLVIIHWALNSGSELWTLQLSAVLAGPLGRGLLFFIAACPTMVALIDEILQPVVGVTCTAVDVLAFKIKVQNHASLSLLESRLWAAYGQLHAVWSRKRVGAWLFIRKTPEELRFRWKQPQINPNLRNLKWILHDAEIVLFYPTLLNLTPEQVLKLHRSNQTPFGHTRFDMSWTGIDSLMTAAEDFKKGKYNVQHVAPVEDMEMSGDQDYG